MARVHLGRGVLIGSAQILAVLPGISRSGVTVVAGLTQGLSHRDAARFSFLLATPVILAAGVLKIPDMFGPLGAGIGGQIAAGSAAAFVCAYLSVRFLDRYFRSRTPIRKRSTPWLSEPQPSSSWRFDEPSPARVPLSPN